MLTSAQPEPDEETLMALKDALAKVGFKTKNIDTLFNQMQNETLSEMTTKAKTGKTVTRDTDMRKFNTIFDTT